MSTKPEHNKEESEDIKDDYEFARTKYYELVEKGDEAIELMLELARESEHPRAFEVLSTMIKQNAEIADRLMDLQKKKKEVKKIDQGGGVQGLIPQQLTQNNVYVGSTTDLQRMLAAKMKAPAQVIDTDDDTNSD